MDLIQENNLYYKKNSSCFKVITILLYAKSCLQKQKDIYFDYKI